MAYDYNKIKKTYESLTPEQQKQIAQQEQWNANFQRFLSEYNTNNRTNTVSTPTTTTKTSPYQNQWAGNYTYNPTSWYYEKTAPKTSWEWVYKYDPTTWYYENTSSPKTNQYTDYSKFNNTNSNNSDFYWQNNQYQWNASTINTLGNMATDLFNQWNKGYSDLMWGSNYADNFDDAVNNKLKSAFWLNNLNELKNKYPEQYESVVQALESVRWVRDATDPTQRQMLDGYLQGIIWSGVGAWSDMSKLNVLNQTLMDKFKNGEQVAEDMRNIVKLQTEWMSTSEIASKMWISEDQVQQAILAYNWLDNKLWEYYQLKSWVASDITEPYDKQLARLDEEKKIALERANRQVDWLKQDFDTSLERQKQQNDINAHNADAIAGRTGLAFSKRGIEWLNYVAEQARQIIDDITRNYDRNNQNLADGIADIIRKWQRNNEDLMKASQDALTAAKNNFTSNMLAVQQQYGTVGLQAQQALANNVQWFIEQAQNIYDNALVRQQQNLTNLINNVSNINALEAQNLTMRNAKIQQFQAESMNLNRNQLQWLAQQLWMDTGSYQDLVNYQVQAVANELNGYMPWAWMQFQWVIQWMLDSWYTPNEAMSMIMNSQERQAMTTESNPWSWSSAWGQVIFNTATGESKYIWVEGMWWWSVGVGGMSGANGTNYVSSQTVDGQTYGVSQATYQWLQSFASEHPIDSNGGQCGKFVNDYLQELWVWRIFTDPIDKKKAAINTPDWYQPQIWDVVVMDSPTKSQYGHVAIITWVNPDWTFQTLESNKNGEWAVFSRTIDPNKQTVYWYYHPDGAMQWGSALWEWWYDPDLTQYYDKWFDMSKDDRSRLLKEEWLTDKQWSRQMTNYFNEKEKTEAVEKITELRDIAQKLLDWNKKNSSKWLWSLHEWWADLETYKEWSYSYSGLWWLIRWAGQTKASEWITLYKQLKNNQSLDKFVTARKNWVTFGSMTEWEWDMIKGAASALNWEDNDKHFEEVLQDMIDTYNEKLAKIWGTWGSGKLKWTIDLASHGRL